MARSTSTSKPMPETRLEKPVRATRGRLTHEVLLISPFLPGEARGNGSTARRTRERLESAGAEVRIARTTSRDVRAALAESRPDVIHAVHATHTGRALAGIGDLPPVVLTIGGNDVHEDLHDPHSLAADCLRSAQVCIAATPEEAACAQRLRGDAGERVLLVPRFPLVGHEDLDGAVPSTTHPVVAWCGALRHQKRPEWALEIHRALRARIPGLVTRIVGPLPRTAAEAQWDAAIEGEDGMERAPIFANGHGGSVGAFLRDVDLVLNTSRTEGKSNFLLEAMHEGVAIVASRCPGTRAWVTHGEQAMLYDRPEEAVELVLALLEDGESRRLLGARARQWLLENASPAAERDGLARAHRIALGLGGSASQ